MRDVKMPVNFLLSLGQPDNSHGYPGASITGGLRLQVISLRMDDDAMARNGIRPVESKMLIHDTDLGSPAGVGLDIPQVAGVPALGIRSAMLMSAGIEVAASRRSVGRGEVAKLMDVEAVLAWSEARHLPLNVHAVRRLGEGDGALDFIALCRLQDGHRFLSFDFLGWFVGGANN